MPRRPSDRRRFRRRTLRVLVDYQGASGPCCEYATTLGAGGLFIETEDPLPVGAMLKLRFRLPDAATLHEIDGRVVWSHGPGAPPADRTPGMGVAFIRAAPTHVLARELERFDEE